MGVVVRTRAKWAGEGGDEGAGLSYKPGARIFDV